MDNATQHKGTQMERVLTALKSSEWLTLIELHGLTPNDPISSISAVMRALQRPEHGAHKIRKRRRGATERGIYEYRLIEHEAAE